MLPLRTEASHLRQTCGEPRIVRSTPQSQTQPKRRRVRSGYLYYRLDPRASPEYPGAFLDGLLHLRSIPHPLALPFHACLHHHYSGTNELQSNAKPRIDKLRTWLRSRIIRRSALRSVPYEGINVRPKSTAAFFNAGFGFSMSRRIKPAAMRPPIRRSPAARLPTIQSR